MLKSCENTGANQYKLEIAVEAAEFEAAAQQEYVKNKNKFVVPGFRKGKAPRKRVELAYGKDYFYREALDGVFEKEYTAAVAEFPHEIVGGPQDFDIPVMGPEGLELSCVIFTKPEISIDGYKGLSAVRPVVAVTDDEVEADVQKKLQDAASEAPVEGRAAQNGDIANIDFEGFIDGVPFDGGKAEGHELELGSGSFIAGFEDQIAGHNPGDEFEVNVTFPEEYAEELAGKPAVFKVKLNALLEKKLPALDDEFAADLGFDTLDELRADIRSTLEKNREESAKSAFDNEIFEQLAALVTDEIPACMIDRSVDNMVDDFKYRLQSSNIPYETYLGYLGMTEEKMRESYRDRAEKDIRIELALEKIAELEAIEVADEEIDAEIEKLAERYNMSVEDVKNAVNKDMIAKDIRTRKASDLVLESAVALAPAEEAEKEEPAKPKKKAAAKKPAKKKAEPAAEEAAPEAEAEAPAAPAEDAPQETPAE